MPTIIPDPTKSIVIPPVEKISENNANQLILLYQSGYGFTGSADISADGSIVAVSSFAGVVLLNGDDLTFEKVLAIPNVIQVAFRPNSESLFVTYLNTNQETRLALLDISAAQTLMDIAVPSKSARALAVSQDGKVVAVGSVGSLNVFDADTGVEILAETGYFLKIGFAEDSNSLWAAEPSVEQLRVFDLATGQLRSSLNVSVWETRSLDVLANTGQLALGMEDGVTSITDLVGTDPVALQSSNAEPVTLVRWSPSGAYLAAAEYDGAVALWDMKSNEQLVLVPSDGRRAVTRLMFSPDERRLLIVASNGGMQMLDVPDGRSLVSTLGELESGLASTLSPDGNWIASGSCDGLVTVLDTHSYTLKWRFNEFTGSIRRLSFSPDGRYLAASVGGTSCILPSRAMPQPGPQGNQRQIAVWDLENGQLVFRSNAMGEAAAFSGDGTKLITCGANRPFVILDVATWTPMTYNGPDFCHAQLATDYSGTHIATSNMLGYYSDGAVTIIYWAFNGWNWTPFEVAYSPDNTLVALTDYRDNNGKRVFVCRADMPVPSPDSEPRKRCPGDALLFHIESETGVRGLSFSPDNRILVVNRWDRGPALYDVASKAQIAALETGMNAWITSDDKLVVLEGEIGFGGTIQVWGVPSSNSP